MLFCRGESGVGGGGGEHHFQFNQEESGQDKND